MAVTWRHLVGSTDRFAIEISLIEDPDGGRFAPPDVSESWGEFRIFVEGRNLCEAKDSTGETLSGARWYLLPLLRFFVQNWEVIAHQGRLPSVSRLGTFAATQMVSIEFPPPSAKNEAAERWHAEWWQFFTQHCLASTREGGIFPNIWVRRAGDDIEISWDNESNPAELPLRFLERTGVALVPVLDFAAVTLSLIGATVDELLKRTPTTALIQVKDELEQIRVPHAERRWLRHALLLNLRRNADEALDLAKRLADRLPSLRPQEQLGPFESSSLPTLVFASTSPHVREDDVILIVLEFDRARGDTKREFANLTDPVPCPFYQAWRNGHDLALRLRNKLHLGYGTIDIDEVLDDLGISVRSLELSDPAIRAVSFHDEALVPTILINTKSPRTQRQWSRAATMAHELCHLVFDDRLGSTVGVSSGPWAPVRFEQRANAFAVMFLMPEPEVSEMFEQARGRLNQRVKVVARHFGASFRATVQHLNSLMLIERYERDSLLGDLDEFQL